MGLHVHSLGSLPMEAKRNYFLYVLDYGWKEPLTDTLLRNFANMARMAEGSQAVVIRGLDPIHFANDVFSWHGINGEAGERVLPAILITTLHPNYFRENNERRQRDETLEDKLLLIPLKDACKTTDDVVSLIRSIFSDIENKKQLIGFSVAKEIKRDGVRRMADALILEPNFSGIGIDLRKLFKRNTG